MKRTIVEWIDELLYSDSALTNEIIFNIFKYSGISNSLDESEDDKFRGYKDKNNMKLDYPNWKWQWAIFR